MNIKRYDIFPVNHQAGNEIENTDGRYVRFEDVSDLQHRLADAERRNISVEFDLQAAAKKLAECVEYPWEYMPEQGRASMREHAKAVIDAALNKPEEAKS